MRVSIMTVYRTDSECNKIKLMNFCPYCGKLLRIRKSPKMHYYCYVCGYQEEADFDLKSAQKETRIRIKHKEKDPLEAVKFNNWKSENFKSEVNNFICPFCKSTKGLIYYRHMRSFSKPTNLFIECQKCGKLVRKNNS